MNYRQRMGLGLAPLLLRLALAVTFIWAGLGKLMTEIPVSGARAAALANMGVRVPGTPILPAPAASDPSTSPADPQPADGFRQPTPGTESLVPGAPPASTPAPAATPAVPTRYAAVDFPEPANVRAVYGVALRLHAAAHPLPSTDGTQPPALWPMRLAQDATPVYLAWAVALTEVIGGVLLLVGFMTRLSALGIALIMLGAIWLDQIGPAVQAGTTVLGFLPDRPPFDTEAWRPLLLQFTLLMTALAVVLAGPGTLAIDNILFGRPRRTDDDDDEE